MPAEKENEKKVVFAFDFEVLFDELTVGDFIGIERVIPEICAKVFSKHVSDGKGGVLPQVQGFAQVSKMNLKELRETAALFMGGIKKTALNPTTRKGS